MQILTTDRAASYGESLFVTILAQPGRKMLWPDLHWQRLASEMKHYIADWNDEREKKHFQTLIDQHGLEDQFQRIRLSYTIANDELPLLIAKDKKKLLQWKRTLSVVPWKFSKAELVTKRVKTMQRFKDPQLRFSCKIGSYGIESLYFLKQEDTEIDDLLWINPDQTIQECTTSNVFYLIKPNLWGTPKSMHCYPGTTREVLMQWLPKVGVEVQEIDLKLQDISQTSGLVFTNATYLMGVLNIPGQLEMNKNVRDDLQQIREKFFLDMSQQASGQL